MLLLRKCIIYNIIVIIIMLLGFGASYHGVINWLLSFVSLAQHKSPPYHHNKYGSLHPHILYLPRISQDEAGPLMRMRKADEARFVDYRLLPTKS